MDKPYIKTDPLYQLLRNEDIKGFNEQRDTLDTSELKRGDYRGRDLRNMNAIGLDFSNSYFRNSDLSGIDFRETNLEVTLRHCDVRELPYCSGVFDLVMTAHVLEHFVDPRIALNEMARVLKPGGLLIACLTRRSPLGMMVHLKWRTHRVTPTQAENWLRESGLEEARSLSFDHRTICQQLSVACVGKKPAYIPKNAAPAVFTMHTSTGVS